jgi:hypothetical protein
MSRSLRKFFEPHFAQEQASPINSAAVFSYQTSADVPVVQATLDASNPFTIAAGSAVLNKGGSAVSGANLLTSTTNGTGISQTIAKAKFRTSGNTVIITLAVATSGADINLTSVVLAPGEWIDLSGFSFSVA